MRNIPAIRFRKSLKKGNNYYRQRVPLTVGEKKRASTTCSPHFFLTRTPPVAAPCGSRLALHYGGKRRSALRHRLWIWRPVSIHWCSRLIPSDLLLLYFQFTIRIVREVYRYRSCYVRSISVRVGGSKAATNAAGKKENVGRRFQNRVVGGDYVQRT